jgi:hypothetical protein
VKSRELVEVLYSLGERNEGMVASQQRFVCADSRRVDDLMSISTLTFGSALRGQESKDIFRLEFHTETI